MSKGQGDKNMQITKKEIITLIHVEITREEFCDNYSAMMEDLYNKRIIDDRVPAEKVQAFHFMTPEAQNEKAQESFTSLLGLVHTATIRYIARSQGLDVDNYGYVDGSTGTIRSVFIQQGAHL